MHFRSPSLFLVFLLSLGLVSLSALSPVQAAVPSTPRSNALIAKVKPKVIQELTDHGFVLGQPVFMRIFKMDGELEVWMKKDGKFAFYKTYPICTYSGYPGPKLYEGDWQSPEGFYAVTPGQMNPNSLYHLSFNVGYPNSFDRARKRTGSSIMVHGNCSSRGCFAMGDSCMEELYLLAHSALANGQKKFSIHIYPFKMTTANMTKFSSSPWIGFWKNLQEGYNAFEQTHQVPVITVDNGKYIIDNTMNLAMADKGRKDKTRIQ